jgi:hypothetical protein
MSFLGLKITRAKFLIGMFLVCSICIFSNNVVSQTNPLPQKIRLGIRTAAFPIGHKQQNGNYGGFCANFLNELQEQLNQVYLI